MRKGKTLKGYVLALMKYDFDIPYCKFFTVTCPQQGNNRQLSSGRFKTMNRFYQY